MKDKYLELLFKHLTEIEIIESILEKISSNKTEQILKEILDDYDIVDPDEERDLDWYDEFEN
jgi:hypothetical protein